MNWCGRTPAGALLVEDAIATFTALDHISWLQCVLSSAIWRNTYTFAIKRWKRNLILYIAETTRKPVQSKVTFSLIASRKNNSVTKNSNREKPIGPEKLGSTADHGSNFRPNFQTFCATSRNPCAKSLELHSSRPMLISVGRRTLRDDTNSCMMWYLATTYSRGKTKTGLLQQPCRPHFSCKSEDQSAPFQILKLGISENKRSDRLLQSPLQVCRLSSRLIDRIRGKAF